MCKTELKRITVFDVLLRRCASDICSTFDIILTEKSQVLENLILIITCIFLVQWEILRFFLDILNPSFNTKKEYYERKPYSELYAKPLSMPYAKFDELNYKYSPREAQKLIHEVSVNGILTGVILSDKHGECLSDTELLLESVKTTNSGWVYITFGNRVNRALFSLAQEQVLSFSVAPKQLLFMKEGNKTYLALYGENSITSLSCLGVHISLI